MTTTPLHVLLIEDNPGDACLVKELLREAGTPITVTAVDTLAAALQLLAERRFDLVLTDLWLPDSQNFETFTRLFNAAPHTPIIVLTGFANEKLGVQAVQAGAQDYLDKGELNANVLIRAINYAIERTHAAESLTQAEAKYQAIIENAVEGFFQCTVDGQYLTINPAFAHIFGYAAIEDLLAVTHQVGAHEYVDAQRHAALLAHLHKDGAVRNFQAEVYRADRTPIWISINARSVRDRDGQLSYCEGMVQDITAHKHLEHQASEAETPQLIAKVACAVVHDINNTLTAVIGNAEILMYQFASQDPVGKVAANICELSMRAAHLSQRLLPFVGKYGNQPETVEITSVLTNVQCWIERLLGDSFSISVQSDRQHSTIAVDPVLMEQAMLNLAITIQHMAPAGGTVSITITRELLDATLCATATHLVPGEHVVINITIVSSAALHTSTNSLFEPFLSARISPVSLGYTVVTRIIEQCHGYISLHTSGPTSMTFQVYLPAMTGECTLPVAPPAADDAALPRGTARILIIEDTPEVLRLLADALGSLGYTVLTATHASAARALITQATQPIDLLLCDVILPSLHGDQLASELCALMPGLRVVLMSGDPEQQLLHAVTINDHPPFLPKPFSKATLAHMIHTTLKK